MSSLNVLAYEHLSNEYSNILWEKQDWDHHQSWAVQAQQAPRTRSKLETRRTPPETEGAGQLWKSAWDRSSSARWGARDNHQIDTISSLDRKIAWDNNWSAHWACLGCRPLPVITPVWYYNAQEQHNTPENHCWHNPRQSETLSFIKRSKQVVEKWKRNRGMWAQWREVEFETIG